MSPTASSVLAKVQSNIAPFAVLRDVFNAIYRAVSARDDAALLLSGSLAGDVVSDLSDVDVEIVARPGTDLTALARWTKEFVTSLGSVVATFPATHLGLADLQVNFLERDGVIVKVDAWTMSTDALPFVADAVVLHDPGGFVADARAKLSQVGGAPDYSDLHNKFVGWMWFTFSKFQRGQLFESVESLEVMRRFALLPFIHLLESNPPHGYRYLEQRLPAGRREALLATYASSHERAEVVRAFWALVELFRSVTKEASARLGDGFRGGDIDRMVQLIRDYEASHRASSDVSK